MNVRDPQLAQQALAIALSPEIPPQAAERLRLVGAAANYQPQLSWQTLTKNVNKLMAPMSSFAPLILAQYIPEGYWNAAPRPELASVGSKRASPELAPELSRGMEAAQLSVAQKKHSSPRRIPMLPPPVNGFVPATSSAGHYFRTTRDSTSSNLLRSASPSRPSSCVGRADKFLAQTLAGVE